MNTICHMFVVVLIIAQVSGKECMNEDEHFSIQAMYVIAFEYTVYL